MGNEADDYGILMSCWWGIVEYDESAGRIRVHEYGWDEGWHETDEFVYDKILGTIHDWALLSKMKDMGIGVCLKEEK